MEVRIEHGHLSVACTCGDRGVVLPDPQPAAWEQEKLVRAVADSVCVLGCCSRSLLGQPLSVACTENFPIAGYQLPPVPLVSSRLPHGCLVAILAGCSLISSCSCYVCTQCLASCKVVGGSRHWLAQRSLENTRWIDKGCCYIFFPQDTLLQQPNKAG